MGPPGAGKSGDPFARQPGCLIPGGGHAPLRVQRPRIAHLEPFMSEMSVGRVEDHRWRASPHAV